MNGRPKINDFGALFSVNHASQVNIAQAPIVSCPTRFHNHLVHRLRAIKINFAWFMGKPGHDHVTRPALQRDEHFIVFNLALVAVDQLILKIHQPLASSCHFADERKTHLAISANFLRLIRDTLVGIGNLD